MVAQAGSLYEKLAGKGLKIGNSTFPFSEVLIWVLGLLTVVFLVLFIVFCVKANKRKAAYKRAIDTEAVGKTLIAVPAEKAKSIEKLANSPESKDFVAPEKAPAPVAAPDHSNIGPHIQGKAFEAGEAREVKVDTSYYIEDGKYIQKGEAYYAPKFENHVAGLMNVCKDPEGYYVVDNYKVGVLLRKDEEMYAQAYLYLKRGDKVLSSPITVRVTDDESFHKAEFLFDVAARDAKNL